MKKLTVTFSIVLISITIIAQTPYCSSTYTNQTDDWITHFEFNNISNYSGQNGTNSYGDYTYLSTYLEYAMTYQAEVTFVSNGYTQHVWIFIDWNQDDDFDESNEAYDLGHGVDETLYAYIGVPNDALPGNTRLRVIEQYSTDPGPCDPHQNIYGETEDYTVDIITSSNIWEGAVDINWHNPANWRYNFVPDATDDVDIWEATNKCWVYAADAECYNLTVRHGTGANFLKVFDEDLHVHGSLIMYGQLILDHPSGRLIAEGNVLWESGSTAYFPNYDEFLVYGDWEFRNGANVQINNGTIEFAGTGDSKILTLNGNCYFNHILCSNTGPYGLDIDYYSAADLNIHGDLTIQPNCSFQSFSPHSIALGGNLMISGSFQNITGNFIFNGDSQVISQNSSYTTSCIFYELTINSTNYISVENKHISAHWVSIENGYIITDQTIHVSGNWFNQTGSPGLSGNSTVEFNGGTYYQHCSNETFHTLEMNISTGGALLISGTDVICSNYKWTAGLIDVEAGGSFTANNLLDNGIFGTYVISSGGTVNLTNYDGYVDLNGDLYIGDGTMNVYGGTTPSYWPYSDNASITMTGGILDFHDQGIYIHDATPYHLTEDITGGTIRTAGSFIGETNEFTPDYGTMEFYGSTDEYISTENGCYLNNVVINKSNTLTISAPPILHIYGNLTINSGVLNTNGNDIEIEGDWTNNVGDAGFIESTGFVAFSGDTNATIFSDETFNDLTVYKAISGVYLATGITINTNNINAMNGDLIFNINSHANIAGDISIHNSYWTLNDNSSINVAGDVTNSGFIDACQGTNIEITVGGNWTDNWSTQMGFISGGETFTINGNSDQIFSTAYFEGMYFNNLTINKTGGDFRPDNTLVVFGDLNITAGDWWDNVAGLTHYFCGNFTIGSSGNYYPEGATMFAGASDQYYQNNGGTGLFKHIYLQKTSGSTLTLNSDMVVYMDKTTVIEEGTLDLNGHLYKATGNVYIVPGGNIIVDAGASLSLGELLSVNYGGQLTAIGEPGNNARIYNDGAGGDYSIKIYDGTISADYATFEDLSVEGLRVHDGAFVDPANSFNNCSFDGYTNPGGSTWLRIDNDQNLTINNISFPNNPGGPLAHNIGKNEDQGHINLVNASGDFSGSMYEIDQWDRIDWIAHEIELDINVFLEGPFNGVDMNTSLNDLSILPLSQPYNTAPWNYEGTEIVASIPNSAIVDWLLIEFRDAIDAPSATPGTKVAQKAVFVKSDGSIVSLDGSSNPEFNNLPTDHLFLIIQHRNHLGIMSANPVTESGGICSYDFTTSAGQAYGTNAQKNLAGGVYGIFGGDANADGDVNTNDKIIWANQAGTQGYKSADFNMNGQVSNTDKNDYWQPNDGEGTYIPQ